MKDTNLIIGKKNTGKTKYVLFNEVKTSIKNNENLCIFDTRDEYFKTFSKELKSNGYNVLVLNTNDASKTNGFNPLQLPYELYQEGRKDDAISLVNDLGLEIFKEDNPNQDPFWQNMASNYFTGLVLILFKEGRPEQINLGSIQVMMNQGEEKYKDITYLRKYLDKLEATSTIYATLSPTIFAPSETRGSIISVCKQKLNMYMYREELLNMLNTNDINIKNLQDKTAIIIISEKNTDLVNIFIDQLSMYNKNFTYILDNFDKLRSVISLNSLLDNATYNNNKVLISIHNEEQLKDLYNKYIIDKFDNIVNLNNGVPKNLEEIPLGNDTDYNILDITKHKYINFKEIA